MPLFGSSKKSNEKSQPQAYGTPYGSQPYPPSNSYPQASAYPPQQAGYPGPGPGQYPNEPPPPYAPSGQNQPPPQYQNPYPSASAYPAVGGAPPMYQQMPQTVYVPNALDSGARVGPMSSQAVPPPPPGCPPNQAQMAAMQGHNVVLGQQKDNWFTGGTGGGYTWW